MFRKRILCFFTAAVCVLGLCGAAAAAEVDCDDTYCFSADDFSEEEQIVGICITGLPDANVGTAMLGCRVIQPGDILTAEQLAQMTFAPLRTEIDREAVVTYLPIYENRVAPAQSMVISVRGKEDKAPVAEDLALETYKNLPNEGALKVSDPEGQTLTYTVTRQPKRGQVTVREDGTFVYTPKKNKVGVDSFVYTATDPAGNVSRAATVTVRILKPADAGQYTDTVGQKYRFAAEWMKNTGIFVGERVGDSHCFQGDKTVSRGEFLAMAVKLLGIPMDGEMELAGYTDQAPAWLKPYLTAALRSGMTAGLPWADTFDAQQTVTGAEAAVMLQNAMDLVITTMYADPEEGTPDWAVNAVTAMSDNGIEIHAPQELTRGQVAMLLYQVSLIAQDAPGLKMFQ